MKNIQKAYAKINLALDVIGKHTNGYHELKTVMQTVSLYDEVTVIKRCDDKITLLIEGANLAADKNNIAYRAASLMMDTYNIKHGYDIRIRKNIPIAAGLAGGSADGSAVIRAIVKLEQLTVDMDVLIPLATKIGADLPFCLVGGTALCEGIGERITPIKSALDYYIVAVNNGAHLSTPEVFKQLNFKDKTTVVSALDVQHALSSNDYDACIDSMSNDLTKPAIALMPQIRDIFDIFFSLKADVIQLSGSGPTVFGLYRDADMAKKAFGHFKHLYDKTFLIKPIREGYYEL